MTESEVEHKDEPGQCQNVNKQTTDTITDGILREIHKEKHLVEWGYSRS